MKNNDATETRTLSLRLSDRERLLIEDAARAKGWKPAHFLRVTALERAAQVLNLSRPTSFDFAGIAKRVADALLAERRVTLRHDDTTEPDIDQELGTFGRGDISFPGDTELSLADVRIDAVSPKPLERQELDALADAMRLGGPEFVHQLVAECLRLTGGDHSHLPSPIDPTQLEK